MAKINKVMIGESLVGDGNEVAHIDLIVGPRGSAAETAFCNSLTNNKDGFTSLLAVLAPNLLTKPAPHLCGVAPSSVSQALSLPPSQRQRRPPLPCPFPW